MEIEPIAFYHGDLTEKFGIPRQAGLVEDLSGEIVFAKSYRNPDALRGIEGFSRLWLVWGFSKNVRSEYAPLVRPPRLGGNAKVGVFASRSPFRPNCLGLSCVELVDVKSSGAQGSILRVSGADLMDATPIYDIKPYLPYADSFPDAKAGYAEVPPERSLEVICPPDLASLLGDRADALYAVLSLDPRPAFHHDSKRIYTMSFAGHEVSFAVEADKLTVLDIRPS